MLAGEISSAIPADLAASLAVINLTAGVRARSRIAMSTAISCRRCCWISGMRA